MSLGCRDHVNDIGPKGLVQHDGTDGSTPYTRMNRYGKWGGAAGENLEFGDFDGKEMVLQLIIDDGVSDRGHRTNIFSSSWAYTGIASGDHAEYTSMACQDFAKTYTNKSLTTILL